MEGFEDASVDGNQENRRNQKWCELLEADCILINPCSYLLLTDKR